MITLDFETKPIVQGAAKSPEPVGLAVRWESGESEYLSWGHPHGNNSSFEKAKEVLLRAQSDKALFHNGQFDLRVADDWFGVRFDLDRVHDTKILAFIYRPNHKTLSLKPLSEEWLGMPPDEQLNMQRWLEQHYPPARRTKTPSKFTAFAPGDIAGSYAVGDVERTFKLYEFLAGKIDRLERKAYEREISILYKVIDMESRGIRIDADRLERDIETVVARQLATERRISKKLGMINISSKPQLAEALRQNALICDDFIKTEKGNPVVAIWALRETCTDQELVDDLEVHSKISKLLGTYMRPWLKSASENNGYFYPYINPTRTDGESGGTRTGRFSSNFQQVPKARYGGLPYMRDYVLADPGHVLIDRDYSQQELRIFAHYTTEGALIDEYKENPALDMHDAVANLIKMSGGGDLDRKAVKICNFLTLYGGGVARLADQLGCDEATASKIKNQHQNALPELTGLVSDLRNVHRLDGFIRTWGGRKYTVEPGFEYKLLNILIQGSAADQTKEAIRRLHFSNSQARLMLQVHDELLVSAPKRSAKRASEQLRSAMEDMPGWDVPMMTDAVITERWGND